jgi:hypothetical protein
VVAAIAAGDFHVWAVETVDEGIELLTGTPAGARGADAVFPEGSVHRRVEDRLHDYAIRLREFGLDTGDGPPPRPVAHSSCRADGQRWATEHSLRRGLSANRAPVQLSR